MKSTMNPEEQFQNNLAKDKAKENGIRAVAGNVIIGCSASVEQGAEVRKELKNSTPVVRMRRAGEMATNDTQKPCTNMPRQVKNDAATPQKGSFAVRRVSPSFFQWVQPEPVQWSWPTRKLLQPQPSASSLTFTNNKMNGTDIVAMKVPTPISSAGAYHLMKNPETVVNTAAVAAPTMASTPELNAVTKQNRLHKWPMDWRFNQTGDKYTNLPQLSKPWIAARNYAASAARMPYMPKMGINHRMTPCRTPPPTGINEFNEMSLAEANMPNNIFYAVPPPCMAPPPITPQVCFGPVLPILPYGPPSMHTYYWDAMYSTNQQNGYDRQKTTDYQGGGGGGGGGGAHTTPLRIRELQDPRAAEETSFRSSSTSSTSTSSDCPTTAAAKPPNAKVFNYLPPKCISVTNVPPYMYYNNAPVPSWMCPPLPLQPPAHAYLNRYTHVQDKSFSDFKEKSEEQYDVESENIDSSSDEDNMRNAKINDGIANNSNRRRNRRRRRIGVDSLN